MDTLKNARTKLAAANKEIVDFIDSFTDGMSFVQTDSFVCSQNDYADAPGEGVVSGFATVNGCGVCVFATNPAVLKGSVGALNAKKITRAINNAVRMDKPLIAVWDTSGARIAEGIDCLDGYGEILRAYTVAYGEVPIISVIKGKNLGISSYVAGLSDFVIALPDAVSASASPLVISAKHGLDEKAVGTCDKLAADGIITNVVKKEELKGLITKILMFFTEDDLGNDDDPNRSCKGIKAGSGVDAVIKEVFDKGSYVAVRDAYAPAVRTGFASLCSTPVGIVATDSAVDGGRLTADACVKISEFLNICENAECPVIFITDCAGTAVCADDARLIREMSNLIYQVNTLDTDMFAVVTGKAIGSAYTALVSPCEYKIAWENAFVAPLESESAARLMYADEIKAAPDKDKAAKKLAESYAEETGSAMSLARTGHFDNVIEPAMTRAYLIAALLAHVE